MGPCLCGHQLTGFVTVNAGFAVSPRRQARGCRASWTPRREGPKDMLAGIERCRAGIAALSTPGQGGGRRVSLGRAGGGESAESPYSKSGKGSSWPKTSAWLTWQSTYPEAGGALISRMKTSMAFFPLSQWKPERGPALSTRGTDQSREERGSPSKDRRD